MVGLLSSLDAGFFSELGRQEKTCENLSNNTKCIIIVIMLESARPGKHKFAWPRANVSLDLLFKLVLIVSATANFNCVSTTDCSKPVIELDSLFPVIFWLVLLIISLNPNQGNLLKEFVGHSSNATQVTWRSNGEEEAIARPSVELALSTGRCLHGGGFLRLTLLQMFHKYGL